MSGGGDGPPSRVRHNAPGRSQSGACCTFWPASEPRLLARAQSGFGSQGSWVGGSPRWAISSVQVSCRRRSSSSVSLSTTSSRVCPSTALILCTTWGSGLGGAGQQSALRAAHGQWHHPGLAQDRGQTAGLPRGGRLDREARRLHPPPPGLRQLPPSLPRTPDTGLRGLQSRCRGLPRPGRGREAG